ncbi:hypothetical protein DY000_02018873 [Brassica cretica]|uniref:Ubiquitin receptor RAD23 n=1 Tax=Brassica cretica TaxID=69181 RepID=A0ABQ7D3V8_BRACR|nr:hypothetical protein DY000_02018873 [Brassica cretica]
MKIFVKTLKGDRFEIQVNLEDSVADVKKNIETVMGVTAEEQMLIHKGKVLKDETTLEANNVSEKSIIGVIKRKPASTATSTSTETPTERASAGVASERVSESSIQKILGMVGGGWDRYMVTSALYLAYDDVDKALEYLYFELPGQSEDPYIAEGTQDQTQEHEAPTEADELRFFDFLNGTPEQEYLRALARSDPSIIKDFVEMLEEQDPPLFVLIQDNKALFLRLLLEVEGGACGNEMDQPHEHQAVQTNEPNNGGDGDNQVGGESEETKVEELQADQTNKPNNGVDGGNQVVGESEETKVEVANPEDNELIEQLEALGFERGDAEVAYFACNKNVQEAANHLLVGMIDVYTTFRFKIPSFTLCLSFPRDSSTTPSSNDDLSSTIRSIISLRGNHPASVSVESPSLSLSSTARSLSLSPRRLRLSLILLGDSATLLMPFDSDQISSDEVFSWVMLSLLDTFSLPMSSVKLDAFDGDLIRLEVEPESIV